MNPNINSYSKQITFEYGSSPITITFGDLFAHKGLKAIPVSRHFFEVDVAQSSLLNGLINKFKQTYKKGWLKKYEKRLQEALVSKDYERAPATLDPTDAIKPKKEQLTNLRQILVERFSNGEIQDLCFDLGVRYDDLPGQGLNDKARELIAYLERHSRILELVRKGEQIRPDIRWLQAFWENEEAPLAERLYPLGTTAVMELDGDNFLLFAVTWTELMGHIPDDNCNVTKLWLALERFWHETRKYALGQDVNIPLIGNGITGIRLDPIHILELNLLALLNAISEKGKITSGEIRIVLYPPTHFGIDLHLVQKIWNKGYDTLRLEKTGAD